MTRTALLLLVAIVSGAATVGCGPGQAQTASNPLPPMQGKAATNATASHDAGAMKALPPRP